jgi:hypothetical protein
MKSRAKKNTKKQLMPEETKRKTDAMLLANLIYDIWQDKKKLSKD